MNTQPDPKSDFIRGFADGMQERNQATASSHWDAWSRNMHDSMREAMERTGYAGGFEEGRIYLDFN